MIFDKKEFNIENLDAVLFDFDGVLAESMNVKTDAFKKLFEKFGEDIVKKVVKHHIENGGISRYKKIEYYYSEYLKNPITSEEVNKIADRFSELVVDTVVTSAWVKGAEGFLKKYYKNNDFFVISGTPQKELELIIKKRNMKKYFVEVYGTPATKPELINKIIDEKNYSRNKVLYIGDSLSDYNAAKETKILFLGRVESGKKSDFPKNVKVINTFLDIMF